MKRLNRVLIILLTVVFISSATGCDRIEAAKVKLGLKNLDFEYIKDSKVDKIIIQSTRDPGFRFSVTDKNSIAELYDLLSTAKEVENKTTLESDYIFEIYEGDEVHKFNYVTGIDKKADHGNLYSDDKIYLVSKRVDNDIINNLWNLRKPKVFNTVYYGSLIQLLKTYYGDISKNSEKIGLDISQDVEMAKYFFSMDIEDFKTNLASNFSQVELVNKNAENYDVLVSVKTYGYKSTVYKAVVTVTDKKDKSETVYYISNKYEENDWTINIYNKKPENF